MEYVYPGHHSCEAYALLFELFPQPIYILSKQQFLDRTGIMALALIAANPNRILSTAYAPPTR